MGSISKKIRKFSQKKFDSNMDEPTLIDAIDDPKGTKKKIKERFKKAKNQIHSGLTKLVDKIFG